MRYPLSILLFLGLTLPFGATAAAQTTEADVYVQQAIIDFDEKRLDQAAENLRRALEIEPDHLEALYYSGVVNMARRQPGAAVPFLLKARERAPGDTAVAYQLGLAYFAQERYQEAQALLEEVFRRNPTLDALGYYVGFMRYRMKDYRGALDAFRTGRASDPEIQQLSRFYSGLALANLNLPTQALAEVEQAMRLAPGSPLTGPAERLRDQIVAARARERFFFAELRLGGYFDDNVAVVPNRDPDPLVAILRQQERESFGALQALRLEYSWLRHFTQRDDWNATVGYSFFATQNTDLPRFNLLNHLLSTGVTYRTAVANMPLQLGAQYAWDHLSLDYREFLQRHTAVAFGTLVPGDLHLTQVFGRFQHKDFAQLAPLPEESRDGENYMVGLVHILRFEGDRHFVKLGYQFDYDDVAGRNYRYRGHRLSGGAQYTLPWRGIRLRYDVDYHIRDYLHVNTILPTIGPAVRRYDEELTNIVRAEIPIPELTARTCFRKDECIGWTLSAEYQNTSAKSNIGVFDYNRNVFSVILSLSY